MPWQRPMDQYPRIWMEFSNEKTKQKFVIKDLSPEYYDIALGYMSNIFLKESAICKPLNILEDPVSRLQMQQKWLKIMKANMAIICVSDDDEVPRVAGIHLTAVRERGQEVITKPASVTKYDQFVQVVEELMAAGDLFHQFGAERFLSSLGLFVLPEFRGLGIATQLLKSRLIISADLGLSGTANVFSTPGACAAARKAGYKLMAERDFYGQKLALMGTSVKRMRWRRSMEGYPRTWMEFTNEKTKLKFKIQDLSPEYYDIVLGYMSNIFVKGSTLCKPLNVSKDPAFRLQLQQKWLKIMKANMAIICVSEDEVPRVAGIHMTAVREWGQEVTTKPGSLNKYDQFAEAVENLMAAGNLFHRFGADQFLSSNGLFVLPEFRRLGIATQLLKCRLVMSKALGLPGTANVFLSQIACVAARQADFKLLAEGDFCGQKLALMWAAVENNIDGVVL